MVQRARRLQELAAEYGKAALRERMGDILMPESWDRDETADSTDGTGYALKVELSPTDDEYWDVHEKLTAQTECGYGAMDGGGESIAGGGGDPDPDGNGAWLSEVHRIQNPYLYTYATLRICIALHCIALHCMLRRNVFFLTKSLPVVQRVNILVWVWSVNCCEMLLLTVRI